ncbi:MAG TPA: rhomboid family intramembrane serine protease [Saprospiraceae bacterium]|nr:rhomboid family intramembrane serine protease [Saprospiraceae bacterium]
MFDSLIRDIKYYYRMGDSLIKLLYVLIGSFLVLLILGAFTPKGSDFMFVLYSYLKLPSSFSEFIIKPWTLITHVFVFSSVWGFIFEVMLLWIFGRIVSDLINQKRILPIFFITTVVSGILFLIFSSLLNYHSTYFGAKAPALAMAVIAASIAPDYSLRFILIGDVKLKFVVMIILIFEFLSLASGYDLVFKLTSISGALIGAVYIYMVKNGIEWKNIFSREKNQFANKSRTSSRKSPLTISYKASESNKKGSAIDNSNINSEVDKVLDKINKSGYDSLTAEEKEILYLASKK